MAAPPIALVTENWERITALFGAARALEPAARAAFLDAACGADAPLRREVQRLLEDAGRDDSFLARPGWPAESPLTPPDADVSPARLSPGMRLGPYEIVAPLGAGGMGEVYKARDTRLKRHVALKSLPPSVSAVPDCLARFQREAEVLAALNHPNIAQIFGLEKAEGVTALVMELVEGPTLADRIARGPLAIDEALAAARQIADALGAAHDQGIVHRDLKPANIKLCDDGTVKVLDFGLAKTMKPVGVSAAAHWMSTTLTSPAFTQSGIILGTPAYMAPEQARGRPADKRADIWAFGALLFEMLTGRRLFPGESLTDTIAAIVKDEPDINAAPLQVHRLLRRCLEKDPKKRLRDIGDSWDLVDSSAGATTVRARGAWIAWSVAGILALAVAVLAVQMRTTPPRPTHLFVQLPDQTVPVFFALSPDGRQVAINRTGNLEIRSLDTGELRTLNGADTARAPFWSPDSRTIAFFSRVERKLKTIPASGGVAQTLCDHLEDSDASGTWNGDGTILFSHRGQLMRALSSGGSCSAVAGADRGVARFYPVFLPDGDHFVYAQTGPDELQTGLFVASLRDGGGKRLLPDETGALFAPDASGSKDGRLLFGRGQALMAAAFDTEALALKSDPAVVADHVSAVGNGMVAASVDAIGTLMYLRNGRPDRQLAWLDRAGAPIGRSIPLSAFASAVSLSPDGRRAAFARESSGRRALWVRDFQTSQDVFVRSTPVAVGWSPDSQRLAFGAASGSTFGIFVRNASGGLEQQIVGTDHVAQVSDWSHDGRWIVYSEIDPRTGSDVWLLPAPTSDVHAPKAIPLIRTAAAESQAQLSPDGKWLAYTSEEAGTQHVYVRPFSATPPLPEAKWQVSSAFGREPRWRADSRELYYLESATMATRRFRLTAVPIAAGATPVGRAIPLFDVATSTTLPPANVFVYAPAPNGQQFLVDMTASDGQPTLDVILNWARGDK
jgi:Tol biopolymer transport system component